MVGRFISLATLLLCLCNSPCVAQDTTTFTIRGTVITPTEVLPDGVVSISGKRIADVSAFNGKQQEQSIDTESVILPGLIDVHNHITWNFMPRWKPGQIYKNRYDWQQTTAYKIALNGPHTRVVADHTLACDADRFGEIKAIIGGATSIVGSLTPTPNTEDNACIKGLARNLDNYAGFDNSILNQEYVRYEVFPFEMGLADLAKVRTDLNSGTLKAFLIHVGEGVAADAASVREFRMLVKRDDGFLRRGVSVIHGVAFGASEFAQIAKAGVGLIWSPRSNIELYGTTTDVYSAKAAGVRIALAPDWSPSGSDGLLEELKYAATWNASQPSPVFTPKELLTMATLTPAQLAGVEQQIGSLAKDHYADLLLIRRNGIDPYDSVLRATPADIRLVVIGGVATYGDQDLMERLLPGRNLETLMVCGVQKALYIEAVEGLPDTKKTFHTMSQELESALVNWGTTLAEVAPCHGENLK